MELALYAEADRVLDDEDYTINKRVAILKTLGGRGSRCTQHLNTFGEEEAADLEAIYHQYALRFRREILQGTFELWIQCSTYQAKKKAVLSNKDIPSEDILPTDATPSKRKTCTSRLEDQNAIRMESLQRAGDYQKELYNRWQCTSKQCNNRKGVCFIDPYNNQHYRVGVGKHEAWSIAITRGEATQHGPPPKVYAILRSNGPVTRASRLLNKATAAQETKNAMQQMMDMQKMQFEMAAQQMMMDSMSSMQKSQEAREQRRDRELQSQIPAYQYQPGPYIQHPPLYAPPGIPPPQPSPQPPTQPPAYSQQLQQQLPRPTYTPPAPPASTQPSVGTPPLQQVAGSSPIIQPHLFEEDEADVIQRFFNWKIGLVRDPRRKLKWQRAKDIAEEQDWKLKDLKQMEDGSSRLYQLAIRLGISNGLARGFREELSAFKPIYREQQAAAALLGGLAQR